MKRETLSPPCTVLCQYQPSKLVFFFFVRLRLECLSPSSGFAFRMNGHSGAAERLLESAGAYMLNTRDAKGR